MFYFMESATIIIFFAWLVQFQGEGCEKEYSLYACDNDEKDGRPLMIELTSKNYVECDRTPD
jgi:hypothetical protein